MAPANVCWEQVHTCICMYSIDKHAYISIHSEGYAVAQWLGLYLQLLGVAMVAGVSFLAVLEHHFSTVDPGMA